MQSLTESVFKLAPPGGVFDDTVVLNQYPGHSTGARRALIHRAVSKGEVLRLKPGLYCLTALYRKSEPHPFVVAQALHAPSQISLESALAFHGLIPEAVHQVTSVTSHRSRTFSTPLGRFVFIRVPCNQLRAGVSTVKLDRNSWAYMATPLRAIADLIYVRREASWQDGGPEFLLSSMRIEEQDLRQLDTSRFDEILDSMRSKRTRRYMIGMKEWLEK